MTLFSKEIHFRSVGTALVSALVLLLGACTEVNDELGAGIIPPGQQFEVQFTTLQKGIESYLTLSDSVATSSLDYAYFGKMTDPNYGARMKGSALVQFEYSLRTDTIAHEDRGSKIDSLALLLGMKTLGGDTLKEQTFDVYRLREILERDSTYYNGLDVSEFVEPRPMFTCTFKGKPRGATSFDTLSLKVADAELAEKFMNDLWSDTTIYSNDSLFIALMGGLCITPSGTSPDDAAIYGLNLQWGTEEGPNSYLLAFGHEYPAGDDPSLVEEEVMRAFAISNNASYTSSTAVTALDYDYSATSWGGNINLDVQSDEPLQNPVKVGYVQGMMGVSTTLELGDEFMEELRALRPEGCEIFINKAELKVYLSDEDYTLYDSAPQRLGAYIDYPSLHSVADYNYYYEENYDVKLVYDGYLNRTQGCYTMDIALHLQQLLMDTENTRSHRMTLGMPDYEMIDDAMVGLNLGENDTPVKIDITYTVIGK